jgi:hypothetical protein
MKSPKGSPLWFQKTFDVNFLTGGVALNFFIGGDDRCFHVMHAFLGAFPEFHKATISFVMSVRPSAWNNSAPIGRMFIKCDI